jgi:hypothetical protein
MAAKSTHNVKCITVHISTGEQQKKFTEQQIILLLIFQAVPQAYNPSFNDRIDWRLLPVIPVQFAKEPLENRKVFHKLALSPNAMETY